jgi:hypothetical protein
MAGARPRGCILSAQSVAAVTAPACLSGFLVTAIATKITAKETLINSCSPYEPPIFRLTSAKSLVIPPVSLRFSPVSDEKSIGSSGKRN